MAINRLTWSLTHFILLLEYPQYSMDPICMSLTPCEDRQGILSIHPMRLAQVQRTHMPCEKILEDASESPSFRNSDLCRLQPIVKPQQHECVVIAQRHELATAFLRVRRRLFGKPPRIGLGGQ